MRKLRGVNNLPADTHYSDMDSPVGKLTIITSPEGLHAILWDKECHDLNYQKIISNVTPSDEEKTIVDTKKQLTEYFQCKRQIFDLPLVLNGTCFQIQAWKQLINIPYATTISYAEQASRIGNKNKARAVGLANGLNPISIIIPCHRVIGTNEKLTGFAGGIDRKLFLINLEKKGVSNEL